MPENISSQFNRVFAFPIETYRSVNTVLDRDSIPGGVRWEGMHVYVSQEGEKKTYELRGGLTNDFWEPISDIDLDIAVDIAFSTTSNNPLRNSTITNGMYQRTQLQTSGQAQVHWDNLTNVPDLVDQSELSNYQLRSEKGQPNGYVPLGSNQLIPSQYLPPLAITHTFVVTSQAAMLALDAQTGDIAVRTDLNNSFILQSEPASTLSNWVELLTPGAPVQSVNGETGTVQLDLSFTGGNLGLTGASSVNLDSRYYTETETDGLFADKADKSTTITAGTGLTGGGDLSANRTLNIDESYFNTNYLQNLSTGPLAGGINISGGNSVVLTSLSRSNRQGADTPEPQSGLYSTLNTTGSTGYPSTTGAGIYVQRADNDFSGSFHIWKPSGIGDEIYVKNANNPFRRLWHEGNLPDPATETWVNEQGFLKNPDFFVDVRQFGATGDGVTDDTAAIQAALDYAEENGIRRVYIATGDYVVSSTLYIPGETEVFGDGMTKSNIGLSPTASLSSIVVFSDVTGAYTNVYKAIIANKAIQNGYDGGTDNNILLRDISVNSNVYQDLLTNYQFTSILLGSVTNSAVQSVKIGPSLNANEVGGGTRRSFSLSIILADNVSVENCDISYSAYESISVRMVSKNIYITGNTISIDKPSAQLGQVHAIQVARPSQLADKLISLFGTEKCENTNISKNNINLINNVAHAVTTHTSDGTYILDNLIVCTRPTDGKWVIKPFDSSNKVTIRGNNIIKTNEPRGLNGDIVEAGVISIGDKSTVSDIPGNSWIISDNIITINGISGENTQLEDEYVPLIGSIAKYNESIIIENNIINIDSFDDAKQAVIGVLGKDISVLNNVINLTNPTSPLTDGIRGILVTDGEGIRLSGNTINGGYVGIKGNASVGDLTISGNISESEVPYQIDSSITVRGWGEHIGVVSDSLAISNSANFTGATVIASPASNPNEVLTGENAGFGLSWNDTDNALDWGETNVNGTRVLPIPDGEKFSFGDPAEGGSPYVFIDRSLSNDIIRLEARSTGNRGIISLSQNSALLTYDATGSSKQLSLSGVNPGIIVSDSIDSLGLIGASDFSANYTNLSYVQKAYVDAGDDPTPTSYQNLGLGTGVTATTARARKKGNIVEIQLVDAEFNGEDMTLPSSDYYPNTTMYGYVYASAVGQDKVYQLTITTSGVITPWSTSASETETLTGTFQYVIF